MPDEKAKLITKNALRKDRKRQRGKKNNARNGDINKTCKIPVFFCIF